MAGPESAPIGSAVSLKKCVKIENILRVVDIYKRLDEFIRKTGGGIFPVV
jgi:hypothetical protein